MTCTTHLGIIAHEAQPLIATALPNGRGLPSVLQNNSDTTMTLSRETCPLSGFISTSGNQKKYAEATVSSNFKSVTSLFSFRPDAETGRVNMLQR